MIFFYRCSELNKQNSQLKKDMKNKILENKNFNIIKIGTGSLIGLFLIVFFGRGFIKKIKNSQTEITQETLKKSEIEQKKEKLETKAKEEKCFTKPKAKEITQKITEKQEEETEQSIEEFINFNINKIYYIYKQLVQSSIVGGNKETTDDLLKQDSIKNMFEEDFKNFKKNSMEIVQRYLDKINSLVIDFNSLSYLKKIILFLNQEKLRNIKDEKIFQKYWKKYWKILGFNINKLENLKIENEYFQSRYKSFIEEIEKIKRYEQEYKDIKISGLNVNYNLTIL